MRADVLGLTASLVATFTAGVSPRVTASPPLELRGPFREHGDAPLYLIKNVTAGVFSGDQYKTRLLAEGGAVGRVSGASATKVHMMRGAGATAELTLEADTGGTLIYSPPTIILHAGSDYSQRTAINIAPGGVVIASEIVVLGRLASGERLAFGRFRSELRVSEGSADACYRERFRLSPAEQRDSLDAALGNYGVVGSLVAAGIDGERLTGTLGESLHVADGCYAGVSVLPGGGAIVKVLADRIGTVASTLRAAEARAITLAGR